MADWQNQTFSAEYLIKPELVEDTVFLSKMKKVKDLVTLLRKKLHCILILFKVSHTGVSIQMRSDDKRQNPRAQFWTDHLFKLNSICVQSLYKAIKYLTYF